MLCHLGSGEVEVSLLERLEVACPRPALTLGPIYNDSDGSLEVGDSPTSPHTLRVRETA